ncbi:NAD(P)/FAD-dependent oxidoreductase [Kitasatospora paracochleata]|uniref:Pyridine nucleotide-disulfide oxidoreductase domain-containing protein 2 n=1 Tax=Kitasatospora paracochleata TaxID=58354 RepID=A0ABT1J426_9ACTN|nr:NAD(P)/FAD-dependent oxidoreductase [Kitasatospora paracochleata]MCP2312173.1 phytoene dehydrogenase-like protein [Kitasatospora paracochleata]
MHSTYDVVIVGGGHNGLVSAAYLAGAGLSVLVLERLGHTGGAAVSARAFPGVEARLSRYSYLVSLLPRRIVDELGLKIELRRRRISSYTPVVREGRPGGLLVDRVDPARTAASFRELTGGDAEFAAWNEFYGMTGRLAERIFPALTEPLPTREELRRRVDDPVAWEELFERPLGEAVERRFADDVVRGVVLTDALIGTFTHAHDPSLAQNRCFLYHVIGGGTGDWDVPVGGMGAVTDALAGAALASGAELLTGCEVTALDPGREVSEVAYRTADGTERRVGARWVLCNAAPTELDRLLGRPAPAEPVIGAQLKVNMLLRRLPRLRDRSVAAHEAFAGTFHIAESYRELEHAYREAAAGRVPVPGPSEIYCHSLADPSILGPSLVEQGFHTLTLFGLHQPAGLFATDPERVRAEALEAVLAPLRACLDEPLEDCLALDGDGRPCLEAKTPLDLEADLRLPGGNIFHRELAFPWTADPAADRWGVATSHPRVLLCGAGAIRGGGVSGIPGHNAAMAVLGR